MIDFNGAVELIRRNGGFKSNSKDTSFYRTYTVEGNRPLQVRVSNHGTHLWTWYDKDFDPSYAINFCIVFSPDGNNDSNVSVNMNLKDANGRVIGMRRPFEVIQYVYNSQVLDINDTTLINQAVQSIWRNKGYKDPLANTPKHAKVMRLKPNEPVESLTENKVKSIEQYMAKKVVRLTESDIHRIVKESVNKILMERRRKEELDEGAESEARFLPQLQKTYENLRREYEHWQYATYKPQGMDEAIDAIIDAMQMVEDIIKRIEPSDNIPTWEDPQQY